MLRALGGAPQLRSLCLSQGTLDSDGLRVLSTLLPPRCALERLELSGHRLRGRDLQRLLDAARRTALPALRELVISCNPLGEESAPLLGRLPSGDGGWALATLDVKCCLLGDTSAQALIEAVQCAPSLTALDVSANAAVSVARRGALRHTWAAAGKPREKLSLEAEPPAMETACTLQ